jgi:thioredoxin 1
MAIDVIAKDANSFIEELEKHPNKQIIVDFWADWCGPCKAVSPLLDEIEQENDDVVLLKVNVDENNALASSLLIQSIPTLMFFKDGSQNAEPVIGVAPKKTIVSRFSTL